MKKTLAVLCAVAVLLCGASMTVLAEETNADTPPLCQLAQAHGFRLGACLSYNQMWDKKYLNLLTAQFNSVTATNEMKAYTLLDQAASRKSADGMPAMNYRMADDMVGWAQQNGIGVRGHTLVWDAYMTDWFFREGYDSSRPYADRETMMARTRSYIIQVVTHFEEKFPGVVYCWDVVNEAVADSVGEYAADDPRHLRRLRNGGDNLFQKYLGDDYVELAFLYAREAVDALGADIKLYYNDYNAYFPDKAKAILALAQSVNTSVQDENGEYRKLMDGIGMQGYIGGYGEQKGCLEDSHLGMIRSAIEGYAAQGLEVQITEMAVRNFERDQAEKHAAYYGNLFRVFTGLNQNGANPLVAVTIWGLTDYPREPKGTYVYNLNSPFGGLVDENLAYKDAFYQVQAALMED